MNAPQDATTLHNMIKELLDIETRLIRKIDTTLWISDPHGAGRRFISILKGRFGLVWRTAYEALPKTFSVDKLEYLDRIIRREEYFESETFRMARQDVISSLVEIIRYKVQDISDFDNLRDSIPRDLKPVVENLILNFPVPNIVYENEVISDNIISSLSTLVKQVVLRHLIILGDVFDRGDEPDKIIRIISQKKYRPYVKFVWGNHDILWMGAAAGNRSLIAEALRISVRYDNMEFLGRLDIDISNLEKLAEKLYPEDVTGKFKAKIPIARKMEKTLAMIQFKLEEKTIMKYPQLEMESRLNLENLARMLKEGDTEGLTDTFFPTLDPEDPWKLTDEEQEVIEDLVQQFTSSSKVKRLMRYLFEEGKLYHINNYILNIHALIPSTADGQFQELYGKKGKELLDHIELTIKNIGTLYLEGKTVEPFQLAVMFYMWCGPRSPFFGKHAMKTFERYFFKDKETHKEKLLHWSENLQKPEFLDLIMEEFGARRLVFGHTPVNVMKGERISTPDGRAINIDGGFSEAYLARGHSLIHTPYQLYAIILPTQEEMDEAKETGNPAKLQFEDIDSFERPLRIRDTYKGQQLMKRREELRETLKKV
jgi:fructose-1,6-bisphosphatase-3